jgi:hypothetical protein
MTDDAPPSDDEVRWAYGVTDRWAGLLARQVMAEDDERLGLTDDQIAFMNSPEVERAQAICDRHRRASGFRGIDFDANRRLPKLDLADNEAEGLRNANSLTHPTSYPPDQANRRLRASIFWRG